jgi:Outer membrane protein Omp28/Secretion system C-terminal sorting domain
MKMRYVSVLVLILALVVSASAYERTVMVEYFSNTACGPCYSQDATVQNWLNTTSRDDAGFMIYHVNWPSAQDWYYVANPTENMARRSVYGLNSVPYFVVDGQWEANGFSSLFSQINSRIGQYTPVEIVLNEAQIGMEGMVDVQVTVNSDEALSGYRLHAVLIDLDCAYGPASNGIQNYRYNMLDMNPSAAGTDLSSIGAGGSETFSFEYPLWDDHDSDNYGFVAFVQHSATDVIQQCLWTDNIQINFPNLTVFDYNFDDEGEVLPNGRPDPGESVDLIVTLQNGAGFLATESLVGTLSIENDDIIITNNDVEYLSIAPGTMMNNAANPFVVEVPMGFQPEYVTFTVDFEDASGYNMSYDFLQLVGSPSVAIVDDSPFETEVYDWWFDIMLQSGITTDILTPQQAMTNNLSEYEAIVWATSNAMVNVLTPSEIVAIQMYLDQGGKMILTGENIGETAGTEDLLADYFGVQHELGEVGDQYDFLLYGVVDGPFPNAEIVTTGGGGANTSNTPASMTPLEGAEPLFFYIMSDYIGGTGYMGDGFTTVYLGFNIESVSGLNDTWLGADVMWQLLNWMDATTSIEDVPAPAAMPTSVELGAYPNPFNAAMTVNYTLPSAVDVQLNVVNVLGQTVAELTSGRMLAGAHEVSFDGSELSSGVYFLQLRAGSDLRMEKVMLLK